jgi:hypothetical protein
MTKYKNKIDRKQMSNIKTMILWALSYRQKVEYLDSTHLKRYIIILMKINKFQKCHQRIIN